MKWWYRSWLTYAGPAGLVLAGLLLAGTVTAQEGAPPQPTGLTADPAHDQVGLDWDDPDDPTITGYRILRRLPALDLPGEFAVLLENTGSALTTYLDTTVTPLTSYVYRVQAINAHGVSERSSWANALTPAAPAPPALTPAQPTGLTADPAHDQVGLDWDDPDDPAITGYRILRRLPAQDLPGEFAVLLENTGSALTTYLDTTVTPQTSYVYRVQAINAHGSSERSSWANALTPAAPALTPAQPTGLTADPAHDQAGLDWDDPDDPTITGYRILRRLPALDLPGEFAVLLENTGSALTTYLDTTVTPQTSYVYRVQAINAHGSSERSSWANALTPAAPAPPALTPAQPTGLTADPASDQVGLDWDDPDDSTITGYRILRRLPAEDPPGEFAVLLEHTGSALTTYVDTTVTPQTSYVYRVQAINAHGSSERSSWANALTPAVPAPTGLRAGTTSAGVSLDWDDPQDATITGYKILRRLGAENSQGEFGVLVEDTGTAATAYLDDTAAGKVRYYYQVQAIRTSGLSAASDSVTVFTRLRPLTVTSLGLLFEAELTVADSNNPSRPSLGLARFGGFGQLTFTDDPQDLRAHFVTTLAYLPETDRQLVLVVHRQIAAPFLLWVGDRGFASIEAAQRQVNGWAYVWSEQCVDWSPGDQLAVRLEIIEPDDARVRHLADPSLASLELGGARLLTPFASGERHYLAELDLGVNQVTLRPEAAQSGACAVEIEPADADPLTAGWQLSVDEPGAEASITVTSPNGRAQRTYTVTFNQAGEHETRLRRLRVADQPELSFTPGQRRYEVILALAPERVTIQAEAGAPDQTLLGHVVRSDEFAPRAHDLSQPLALSQRGDTLILVEAHSEDGLRRAPYSLRLRPPVSLHETSLPETKDARSRGLFSSRVVSSRDAAQSIRQSTAEPRLSGLSASDGALNPVFNAETFAYSISVRHGTAQLTVTPTAAAGADWLIASPDADSEAPGHQVALTSPQGRAPAQTSIVIVVRSADQLRLDSYTITVTRDPPPANDSSLSQLRISDVGMNPDFAAERTYYETSLVAAVSRLTVEAVPAAPGATVVITPADADPDTPEHEIDLGRGDFKIRITVTAPDETTSRTYLVQLLDDRLQLLSVGHVHIELQPATTEYSIVVPEEVTEVRLEYGRQYQRNQPRRGPHVSYDQSDQSHGIYGRQVSLQAGVTNVVVTAWSKRRLTSQVYNLAITRAAPAAAADAKLSALQLSEGTPITFDPLVGWYWVTDVGESVSSLTLTASAAQTGATVVIEPPDADPALEGYQIAFTGARMRVTVTVTSTDDSATRTYTLSLHRKLEWADFELGWTHGCGLRSDGRIICGGERDDLGVMHSNSAHVPSAPGHYVYRDVHVGKYESCGTLVDNTFHCWTTDNVPSYTPFNRQNWQLTIDIPEWGGVKQVAYFTWGPNCWLSSDGTVDCWNPDDVPEQVRDQSHQAVSVGSNYACVVDPDSAIVCWTNVGVIPTPAGEFKDVAAGGYSLVCGIRTDGSLLCWTYGGRLQSAPSGPYRIVRDDRSHRYVSADATYVKGYCAVRENGEILCGLNADSPDWTVIFRAEPPSATFEHLSLGYRPGAARPCGLTSQGRIQCRTQTWYPALTNPDWLPRLSDNPALKSLVVDGLRLVPQFNATVSSYAATAEVDEERLTLLATTADSRSSMSISHADADPDTDGHQVDFAVGVTVIRFSILAEDGVSAKTYKLVVTRARPDPDDASLSQLRISDVGLNPDFVAERINYETSLVAEVTRLTVEAVPTAPGATVVITPTDADPDTPEHEIDLGRRDFKIRVKVTAPDETTSRTYQVQLFDDRLRLLSVGHVNIELTPTTTEYSIAVPEEVTEVGLNYGRQNSTYRPKRGPHVSYGQRDIGPGVAGHQIPLQAGVTNVAVTAWSKHRLTSQVYNLAITRAAPAAAADAKLSMLQLSEGTPITFDPLVGWYWVTDVGESVESLTLTASAAQTGASVVVEPPDADAALEGYQIAFTGARMRVTVTVTSTDDSATRTYTLSLHRKLEWADFELGWTHGCGLRSDGRIICSGEDDRVGVMHSNSAYVPSAPDHYVYRDVHVAKKHSCGTLVNNTFHCWTGGNRASHTPLDRQDWSIRRFVPEWGGVNHIASFSSGGTCWVSRDGAADCWGIPLPSTLSDEVHQMVAVAYNLSCVLDSEGAIRCWTFNGTIATPDGEFKFVAAGARALVCGIKLDDSLLCWKYTTPDRPTDQFRIVMSDSDHRYTLVDVTYSSTYCALRDDGTVLCHGNVDYRSSTSIERATPGTAVIEHISMGYRPSYPRRCGLNSEGRIQCWTHVSYEPLINPDWMED